jgi:RNA polymerase sigma-70 factor (ECF subfamily)
MDCAGQVVLDGDIASAGAVELETVVRDYARFVYRVAFSVLRHHHDAEDATQETFVRVLKHRRELAGIRDPKLWLARIAWRIAVDKKRRLPEQSLDAAAEAGVEIAQSAPGAEQAAIAGNQRALLERMVASLPRDLRDAVTLSTVAEMASGEIAAVLGIPEASVRTRLFRARQMLKEKLVAMDRTTRSKMSGQKENEEVNHER